MGRRDSWRKLHALSAVTRHGWHFGLDKRSGRTIVISPRGTIFEYNYKYCLARKLPDFLLSYANPIN